MNGPRTVRALACALLLAVPACGDTGPRQGGTVVIAAGSDLDFANPLVSVDAYTNEILRYVLFTPLIQYDAELDFRPALARSWDFQGDTVVTFHLRDDVRWHDGRRTTASDVLFTFERAKDPATGFPNADYFARWTGGEVVDSYTVRFRMEPHADPLGGWPFTPVVPRHVLDTVPPEALRQTPFNTAPVGNGPFRFVRRRAGDRWVFEANEDYPEEMGAPRIQRLVWRVIPDNAAQMMELRVGQVDLALQPQPAQVRELSEQDGIRALLKPGRRFMFIVWNGLREPLDDARVRRALALAIDRGEILEALRAGFGEPGVSAVAPFHWAWNDSLTPLPFDPDSARALLAAAGIEDRDGDGILELPSGDDFSLDLKTFAEMPVTNDLAAAARNDLAAIGVDVSTRPTEVNTLFADVTSTDRRFDAALLGWAADFRVDLRDLFHSAAMDGPYQFASYANAEVDSLLDRATAEPDRAAAAPLWHRVQAILLEEQPWTLLYYQTDAFLARERVRGMDMDIRGALVNVTDWWVQADRPETAAPPEKGG